VSGKDEKQHLQILEEVFRRLEKHGFRLKQEKCEFFTQSVEYLGHAIDQVSIFNIGQAQTLRLLSVTFR